MEKTPFIHTEQPVKDFEELVLTKIKFRATTEMTRHIFQDCKVEVLANIVAEDLYYAALQLVTPAKETIQVLDVRNVPLTWWDHIKIRFFPRLKARTEEIEVSVNHYHVCPHLPMPHCERDAHFRWLMAAGEGER